ncbi:MULTISPECIES: hypothetical protein [unclassified Variovorax]|uniref:hypothetical protein n=1 Tax=unclassified Variovorax TaxID=663243 RepID=UPI00076C40AF|nr:MULTISPECIES: hypothetical protein [unclassified Variovorax]KWT98414.1 hypothetical protein APY03_0549 [Variovorax sp. WDL1]PNG49917.1 hypothetical protein CHC06_05498 [Variovorax sp. B2]PNG50789.1 hypothetical protein CHC07_05403 [Variovorax sp. B4]VTV18008.1 hypothetical protein WDL1P1_00841 [Variovorax sp. WDL1]
MLFHRRVFSLGSNDGVPVLVRRALVDGHLPYVVFREEGESPFRGALRANFESVATQYYLELIVRGQQRLGPHLHFVHERPLWSNGVVTFSAEWNEVHMELTPTGYRRGRWEPVTPEVLTQLSGELQPPRVVS